MDEGERRLGWVAEPAWKKEFRLDQLDELIDHLIEKTSNE